MTGGRECEGHLGSGDTDAHMVALAIDEVEASQHDATLNGGSALVRAGVAALHPLHVRMQQGARHATLHLRKGGARGGYCVSPAARQSGPRPQSRRRARPSPPPPATRAARLQTAWRQQWTRGDKPVAAVDEIEVSEIGRSENVAAQLNLIKGCNLQHHSGRLL
jgi:hypothetical protein